LTARAPPAIARGRPPPLTIEIQIDTTSARLPLVVAGSDVAFTDVDRALDESVAQAMSEPPGALAMQRAHQLRLLVELVETRAERAGERLVVHMLARATLREASGNAYVAQTQVLSSASGSVDGDRGAKVVRDCTDDLGSKLSGWIAGIDDR
jgi:hypothetical protein